VVKNVGEYDNVLVYNIKDANGEDVTDCYNITYQYGTLKVDPRKLHVAVEDLTKEYDATPLKGSEYTLTDLVISQKLISRNAKDYERLDKLMLFLRSKGAKPACALQRKVTPEQKILNELSFLKQREKVLSKALNQYRSR
jgi:hypothetical protein